MKWQDPPPVEPRDQRAPAPEWVAECRAHPKRWAMVMACTSRPKANYYQSQINLGLWRHIKGEVWEATYRANANAGTFDLYVRFIRKP